MHCTVVTVIWLTFFTWKRNQCNEPRSPPLPNDQVTELVVGLVSRRLSEHRRSHFCSLRVTPSPQFLEGQGRERDHGTIKALRIHRILHLVPRVMSCKVAHVGWRAQGTGLAWCSACECVVGVSPASAGARAGAMPRTPDVNKRETRHFLGLESKHQTQAPVQKCPHGAT